VVQLRQQEWLLAAGGTCDSVNQGGAMLEVNEK
jgi:hypothetical protein